MKKKTLVIFVVVFSILFIYSLEDTQYNNIIVLKDGKEYRGKLKKIEKDKIIFEINGEEKEFKKSDISGIQFNKKRMYEDVKSVGEITDTDIKRSWEYSRIWKTGSENEIVILLDKAEYEFLADKKVKINIKKIFKILNEEGKEYSTDYFYFFKNISNANLLYGITVSPQGQITSIEESAINEEPINNKYPQYDTLHRIKFGFKNVEIGSVCIWEAEIIREWDFITHPFMIERYLIDNYPVVSSVTNIKAPKDIELNYYIYKGLISFNESQVKIQSKDDYVYYSYEQNDNKAFINDEDNVPSSARIYPRLIFSPKLTWMQISDLYNKTIFDKPISNKIKKAANSIIKNEKEINKILKLLYEHVSRKINTASIDMNDFSFTPLDEEKILNLSSLNILDKAFLFTRLARSLNIPMNLLFYRNKNKNELINECPNIKQFGSVLCETEIKDKKIYFCFDDDNLNADQIFPYASEMSYLYVSNNDGQLKTLRKITFEENKNIYEYKCKLNDDGSLKVKRITTLDSCQDSFLRFFRFLTKDILDQRMKSRAKEFGNDAIMESYSFLNKLDDFDKPIMIEENMNINNYAQTVDEKTKLIEIPGLDYKVSTVSKEKRLLPMSIGYPSLEEYKLELIFPEKYKISFMPEALNIDNNDYFIKSEFKVNNNIININLTLVYKKNFIETKEYLKYKIFREELAKLSDERILLEAKE